MVAGRRYAFGEYTLDLWRGALLKDGADVKLRPKSFEVLRLLVERHGQLVTKEELLAAVWGPAVVTDGAVGQCLIDVRRAIGDESQHVIRTVPRRGYIFDVPVIDPPGAARSEGEPGISSPPRSSRIRWPALALIGAAVVAVAAAGIWWVLSARDMDDAAPIERAIAEAPRNSIAVLPFVNMSAEPDQEYFSDGISEEILNLLAQTPGLQVIARTSSFSFKDRNVDVAQIAGRLNVSHVLEGSVRKTGDRVRITAQLIDAGNSTHLWSSTYDRTLDDILRLQSEIAGAVAQALKVQLLGGAAPIVKDPAAYERYLQGQFFFGRRSDGDMERAASYYREAVAIDPKYARAWAGLGATAFISLVQGDVSREVGLEQLRIAAEKAVALDPDLAEGHFRLANYLWLSGKRALAVRHWQRAQSLAPNSPLMISSAAGYAAEQGRLDESIELWERVVTLDPLSATNRNNYGYNLYLAGRYEEAQAELLKALDLNPDGDRRTLGFILILQGRFSEAHAWLEQSPAGPARDQGMAMVNHALGRKPDASAALARLTSAWGASDPFPIAEVYAYRDDVDGAFQWLQAVDVTTDRFDARRTASGDNWEMPLSPFLKSLHADPRWPRWVAKVRSDP